MLEVQLICRRGDFELEVAFETQAPVSGVVGPSGAGKTTLLSAISGLVVPDQGRIVLRGEVLYDAALHRAIPTHLRRIATVFQDGRLLPHLDVRANLNYGLRRTAPGERRCTLAEIADLVDVARLLPRRVTELSGGERQRVALGRALLMSPRLLLLDEPLSGLDRGLRGQVLDLLLRIKERLDIPMLMVSHQIGEILQLTDQLIILDDGRQIAHGHFQEVLRDDCAFRLAHRLGLENILAARVERHELDAGLTHLHIAGHTIVGPHIEREIGANLRVAVRPEDIAVSSGPLSGTSIRNQVPGRVVAVDDHAGRVLLTVDIGSELLVEVSGASSSALQLHPGAAVYCVFKALAVRVLTV